MTIWKRGEIVYQIYPLSFKDTNGDGYGDLEGIIEKLDYLKNLGITAIWLSPIYTSPMADWGYDVADYYNIDPIFGDFKAFDHLVTEAHTRHIKIMMDYIPNHTSDKHPWFIESRTSKNNPKRDWYVWHDPSADGSPPNNWVSVFGGSSWEYDRLTKQYYFHQFLKEQPDLNWRNPEVQKEMLKVLEFWMRRGVDGFRIDALFFLFEDKKLRNDPKNHGYHENRDEPLFALKRVYDYNQPEVFDFIDKVCSLTTKYPNKFLISEIPGGTISLFHSLYRISSCVTHIPFNFSLIGLPWNACSYKNKIKEYLNSLDHDFWPNFVLSNHDVPRIVTRTNEKKARLLAMLQLTLPGISFIYNGDEIGMENALIDKDTMKDPYGIRVNPRFCRDGERTPMQWDKNRSAGFSKGNPWLPLSQRYASINVEKEEKNKKSMLQLYRELISMKKTSPVLVEGTLKMMDDNNPNILAYVRTYNHHTLLVIINFSTGDEKYTSTYDEGIILLDSDLSRIGVKFDLSTGKIPALTAFIIKIL